MPNNALDLSGSVVDAITSTTEAVNSPDVVVLTSPKKNQPRAKKKWQLVNGLVLLNKPVGVSSNGIMQQVKRIYNAKKAGHTGALDPFATGLLPICLGEATKVSGLLLDSDKAYIATLRLGVATDSGDKDGHVSNTQAIPPLSDESIKTVLASFEGDSTQIPPMYSALKHKGKPLYFYARQGIEIERPARPITLSEMVLIDFDGVDTVKFSVHCSKGTYIRTVGEDIALKLGTVGHLIALHRIKTGSLTAEQMVTIEEIEANPEQHRLAMDLPLAHLTSLHLNESDSDLIMHGGVLSIERPATDLVKFYNHLGQFFGVGEWLVEKNWLKPKRLFNL